MGTWKSVQQTNHQKKKKKLKKLVPIIFSHFQFDRCTKISFQPVLTFFEQLTWLTKGN